MIPSRGRALAEGNSAFIIAWRYDTLNSKSPSSQRQSILCYALHPMIGDLERILRCVEGQNSHLRRLCKTVRSRAEALSVCEHLINTNLLGVHVVDLFGHMLQNFLTGQRL